MALFLIERNFAEQLNLTQEGGAAVKQVNAEVGVNWLFSFLSADKKKTYCLYEAPNAELIREAARRNNLPADVIVSVNEIQASAFA
jgi:Nickel responsive protein SCO4226-like